MTAILVFITFAAFIVVDRFSNRQAAKNQLQAVFVAETGGSRNRSMAVPAVASAAREEQETADHGFQLRAGHDRRRGDRRRHGGQSAA